MPLVQFSRRAALAAVAALICAAPAIAQDQPRLDVPYVPTPQPVVDRMLELAEIKPGEFVMDLGSGDGRIAVTAARKYGARALGIDLNPVRVKEGEENAAKAGVSDRVKFRVQNLFEADLGQADVITMYLLTRVNLELRPKLFELRPGTRLVSHSFDLGEWEADKTDQVNSSRIFYWVVPAKVGGRWEVSSGETKFSLDLKQAFQQVSGSAQINGREVPVQNGRLHGAEITFTVDGRNYRGRVDGKTIESIRGGAGPEWRATRQAG
jgi:SAM-dependent methyltransferase